MTAPTGLFDAVAAAAVTTEIALLGSSVPFATPAGTVSLQGILQDHDAEKIYDDGTRTVERDVTLMVSEPDWVGSGLRVGTTTAAMERPDGMSEHLVIDSVRRDGLGGVLLTLRAEGLIELVPLGPPGEGTS